MKRLPVRTAALALIGMAAPAAAQGGAMWVDGYGRIVSVQFAGGSGEAPAPADRSAADMANLFKRLCLDSGGSEAAVAQAASAAGLTADPLTVPGGKKAAPLILGLWRGDGLVVSRTDGFVAASLSQCNSTFYVNTLPDRSAVASALSEAIGAQPSNLAAATDKKGQPKKNYTPEWTVEGPSGPRIVTAMVGKGSQYMPGNRVQLSVRASKKAAVKK